MQSGSRDSVEHRLYRLVMDRARQLLAGQGFLPETATMALSTASQEERRALALAVLAACKQLTTSLSRRADIAAGDARYVNASYTEIGAARGVTRQAARQGVLRAQRREDELRERRRDQRSDDDQNDWQYQLELQRREREEHWPPRAWRHRAPTGLRTVALVDGPAVGRAERVPAGDDAFVFIDHYDVFGQRHARYARYTAATPGSDQYRFTGEYFIRWS